MPSTTDPRIDRLHHILRRALHRAELTHKAKKKLKQKTEAEMISEDYAKRLADKALYRRLLSDERFDGLRFRWFFQNIQKDTPLEELRVWIDSKIIEEDTHHVRSPKRHPPLPPRSEDSPASPLASEEPSDLLPSPGG
jgi:hypothetical protein